MNAKSEIENFIVKFQEYDESIALIYNNSEYSYTHLVKRIDYWREKLSDIKAGTVVGIEGDFSPETISILFSLIDLKVIVVPLDINHSNKNEEKYKIAQLQLLIRVKSDEQIEILDLKSVGKRSEMYDEIIKRNVSGLVLFTSGSSGKPKGAVHDFTKLLKKYDSRRKALKTINFLLFDHWGGLNTLFHILSNGGTVVILKNRAPDYVCELIEKYNVELLPASPTFLNMLILSKVYEKYNLKSLEIISYGAEPMPENLLNHLNRIFPNIKLQQTYGLIELGVLRSKSEDNGSLWVKIGGDGYETRIVDGILQIKSDSAMIGYLNAESPFTEDGWFITGDIVEEKGDYLKIFGRKSEIINVGGEKVFPQEVENTISELSFVNDVIVYGEDFRLTGKIVCAKVFYTGNEEKQEIIRKIKTHCRLKLQNFKVPVKIELTDKTFENDRFKKNRINGV